MLYCCGVKTQKFNKLCVRVPNDPTHPLALHSKKKKAYELKMLKSLTTSIFGAFLVLALNTTPATAEVNCSNTRWKMIDDTVAFGTPTDKAVAALKKKYASQANVSVDNSGNIVVSFLQSKRDVFDMIVYMTSNKTVFKAIFSYSNQFQAKMGGLFPAILALTKKIIARVGEKADNAGKQAENDFLASWNANDGAIMEVYGKDPNVLVVRFTCETLEESLRAKQAESTNFGF